MEIHAISVSRPYGYTIFTFDVNACSHPSFISVLRGTTRRYVGDYKAK